MASMSSAMGKRKRSSAPRGTPFPRAETTSTREPSHQRYSSASRVPGSPQGAPSFAPLPRSSAARSPAARARMRRPARACAFRGERDAAVPATCGLAVASRRLGLPELCRLGSSVAPRARGARVRFASVRSHPRRRRPSRGPRAPSPPPPLPPRKRRGRSSGARAWASHDGLGVASDRWSRVKFRRAASAGRVEPQRRSRPTRGRRGSRAPRGRGAEGVPERGCSSSPGSPAGRNRGPGARRDSPRILSLCGARWRPRRSVCSWAAFPRT